MVETQVYNDYLRQLIEVLPLNTIEYAFAYGSGAIEQQNEKVQEKMIDFILVTRDVHLFHQQNLAQNFNHYSALKLIGSTNLSVIQTNFCARVYYNTMIKSKNGNKTFKYGVIGVIKFIMFKLISKRNILIVNFYLELKICKMFRRNFFIKHIDIKIKSLLNYIYF